MKRRTSRILSLLCSLALMVSLAVPAVAAGGAGGISVQLDGKDLAFTDAVPEVVDQRTFLPFRAVFEAMGATVDYDSAAKAVVAARGGRSIRMVIGAKEATVTVGGVEQTIPMDVAAFAKNNRTYVPVRFAAQALGCNVGWDQKNQTVIIVDVEKLVEDLLAGEDFSLYNRYMAHRPATETGNQALAATIVTDTAFLHQTMEINGIASDKGNASELTAKVTIDGSGYYTASGQEVPAGAKVSGALQLRSSGSVSYLTADGDLGAYLGLPENAWVKSPRTAEESGVGELSGLEGLDELEALAGSSLDAWNSLMKFELGASLEASLPGVSLNDRAAAMDTLRAEAETLAGPFRDGAFTKSGNTYSAKLALSGDDKFTCTLDLTCDGSGKVTGYKTVMSGDALSEDGSPAARNEIAASFAPGNKVEYRNVSTYPDGSSIGVRYAFQISSTSKSPQTAPPAGASVLTAEELGGLNTGLPNGKVTSAADAAALVKGAMDACYTGKCDSAYLRLTGRTAEEIAELHQYNLSAEYDYLCYMFEIDDYYIADETRAALLDVLSQAYGQTKYTVTASALSGGEYSVKVSLTPCTLFADANNGKQMADFAEAFNARYDSYTQEEIDALSGKAADAFWTTYEQAWADGILEILQDQLKAGTHQGTPVTKLVLVSPTPVKGLHTISSDDFSALDALVLPY